VLAPAGTGATVWLALDDCGSIVGVRLGIDVVAIVEWQGSLVRLEVRPASGAIAPLSAGTSRYRSC